MTADPDEATVRRVAAALQAACAKQFNATWNSGIAEVFARAAIKAMEPVSAEPTPMTSGSQFPAATVEALSRAVCSAWGWEVERQIEIVSGAQVIGPAWMHETVQDHVLAYLAMRSVGATLPSAPVKPPGVDPGRTELAHRMTRA